MDKIVIHFSGECLPPGVASARNEAHLAPLATSSMSRAVAAVRARDVEECGVAHAVSFCTLETDVSGEDGVVHFMNLVYGHRILLLGRDVVLGDDDDRTVGRVSKFVVPAPVCSFKGRDKSAA